MFGDSEYIKGGEGCGCTSGGKFGGGVAADMWPKKGMADAMNPKNWTVHNMATVLMIIGIVCLIIYTFLPGTGAGWAYAAGVFAAIYVIIDLGSVTELGGKWLNVSASSFPMSIAEADRFSATMGTAADMQSVVAAALPAVAQ